MSCKCGYCDGEGNFLCYTVYTDKKCSPENCIVEDDNNWICDEEVVVCGSCDGDGFEHPERSKFNEV